jgi:hypothetical protein
MLQRSRGHADAANIDAGSGSVSDSIRSQNGGNRKTGSFTNHAFGEAGDAVLDQMRRTRIPGTEQLLKSCPAAEASIPNGGQVPVGKTAMPLQLSPEQRKASS